MTSSVILSTTSAANDETKALLFEAFSQDNLSLAQSLGVREDPTTYLNAQYVVPSTGLKVSALSVVVLAESKRVFAWMVRQSECNLTESLAAFDCIRFYRWNMAMTIVSNPRFDINFQHPESGDTILHAALRFQRPNVSFIRFLLFGKGNSHRQNNSFKKESGGGSTTADNDTEKPIRAKVNFVNNEGLTPLCIVSKFSIGVDGRDVVVMLLRRGARRTPALETTTNVHIRVASSLQSTLNRAVIPIPKEIEAELDLIADVEKLPDITQKIIVQPPGRGNSSTTSSPVKGTKTPSPSPSPYLPPNAKRQASSSLGFSPLDLSQPKKLTRAQLNRSVEHLSQIIMPQAVKDDIANEAKKKENRKVLDPDSIDELTSRLCDSVHDTSLQNVSMIEEMYARPVFSLAKFRRSLKRRPVAEGEEDNTANDDDNDEEELTKFGEVADEKESAERLCFGSLQKRKEQHDRVFAKYVTEKEALEKKVGQKKKLTKSEFEAVSQRLCVDTAANSVERLEKMYATHERGRFEGGTKKMTKSKWEEMGKRLCTPKQR
eukprot:PhM_4_TR11650/c0_g1_i2/m.16376